MTSHSEGILRFPHNAEPFIRTHMCFILIHVLYFKREDSQGNLCSREDAAEESECERREISFQAQFIRRESHLLVMMKRISCKMWQWLSLSQQKSLSLQTFKFLFRLTIASFRFIDNLPGDWVKKANDRGGGEKTNFHLIQTSKPFSSESSRIVTTPGAYAERKSSKM